ncbi:Phosphoacetylglucosamine mutase [Blastocladiella britannica]|nr:Phosphoacetylglucosamine mutase [Blastocladiella britannica]
MTIIATASAKHPIPAGSKFTYGTAGFRMRAELLDSVTFRVGLLAALRSRSLGGRTIGVMITASHNPVEDNGVKLADPLGEMLKQSWEAHATTLANAPNDAAVATVYAEIAAAEGIDLSIAANVVFARDTRPSGPALVQALVDGLTAAGANLTDFGVKTTPQLHYVTRCINDASYGEPTEEGYYKKLSAAYQDLVAGFPALNVTVDCANGVGAPKLKDIAKYLGSSVHLTAVNDDIEHGILNHRCGADFVKVGITRPDGFTLTPNGICASFDGDADRIVFYYADAHDAFHLLDGDRISALVGGFIIETVRAAGLALDVGVVQTAYANGNSTHYLRDTLGVPVAFTQTGVKHLHHKAEEYDVGVYFEANGHGTTIFSRKAHAAVAAAVAADPTNKAVKLLHSLITVTNETVGDAISDLLVVLAVLTHKKWTLADWDALYDDLPSRLVKVVVGNRHAFKAINADTVLESPAGLQSLIDAEVAKIDRGRSFVRPSGTEDVVRVYAEAATREACDVLAYTVAGIVFDKAGGVGERPKEFL